MGAEARAGWSGDVQAESTLERGYPSSRSQRGLDWLTFFISDVQAGFGPFVAAYLGMEGWSPGEIGLVLTFGTVSSAVAQTPAGMLVDAVRSKRLLVAGALVLTGAGALLIALWPSFVPVAAAEIVHGASSSVLGPAVAAIGLGLVGHRAFSGRLGRNDRYQALGTGLTAVVMGVLGNLVSKRASFFVVAAVCLPGLFTLTRIDAAEIDYARARSASRAGVSRKGHARYRDVAKNRDLLAFIACLTLFQLGNASLLPLASGRLGVQQAHNADLLTAGMVAVPQFVTALVAIRVARLADTWGRRPLLLLGFAALPIRALIFALARNSWEVVAVQTLDGITAAVLGVLTPLVVADLVRGTGRYNLALGATGTAIAAGAALSTTASGFAVQAIGYMATFLVLAGVGLLGVGLVWWRVPETQPEAQQERSETGEPSSRRRDG